ncbi:galactosyl transferase GMA12/MNN10 family protein [Coccidioides posadasii C735 delta SOWgp]|uniref:Alpha-1,2-galactosyltransferase n=2 Tax=Coccidioides posadasii TaxID=199306 RepID=A0A0J6F6V8_COCPO|nr:galactosyl transferase GMA12/MNN10 family protein [Coccidioides posadasii C735 delta SOWgp]EER23594.1 galactosyl transferase GMA12/MNN10 family protein [Coccidioides posadasii C735 delta SOWgp]KMM65020.1 alpha-1,2-galactosyltransferase [Coccidioides posadasii RMSCC 3488]|eukprot:XP_003065739.1 galactosyl transferase GMA12/MNN10 family protein [Coccidioides posadasii C735 delta SOWgp]
MQFALPPRKSSNPPLYARPSPSSALRRRQLKSVAVLGFIIISVFFFISHIFSSGDSSTTTVASGPKVVLVTVLDEQSLSDKYIQRIKQNREDYVKRHGYINFFASTSEYVSVLNNAPRSWASVPAVRHAMTLYPGSTYFFHLSPHSLIMDPTIPITSHVLDPKQLESLMLKDIPVVPPDSVIKTFSHLSGKDVDLVITQDAENLCPGSFVIRQGEWAKYFLDAWFDPLYRRYNFAKAETHALDHIVQWHPTMLARLALVPQRILNSYSPQSSKPAASGKYREGDFLIRFKGCEAGGQRNCEQEMEPYFQEWAKKTGNDK